MPRDIDWKAYLNRLVYWTNALGQLHCLFMSARFWDRADRSGGEDACWTWSGSSADSGYGWFWWSGQNMRAHRAAWVLTHGPIENDLCVLHECDNPGCVNPKHLFLGTHADNMADKVSKGRQTRGEDVNTSKLDERAVVEMRGRYAEGETQRDLAGAFGMSRGQVSKIVRGLDWKHAGGPVGSRGREVQTPGGTGGKLSKEDVILIRSRFESGESQVALAREYNVTPQAVFRIVRRKTWRHL